MKELQTLGDLLANELRVLFSAEQQLQQQLPLMIESAAHGALKEALERQQGQAVKQRRRLEQIFEQKGETPEEHASAGMAGLIQEARELTEAPSKPDVRDAGLIALAQRIAHYEIAAYGCARTYAKLLGDDWTAQLLQMSLDDEKQTDQTLNSLAERVINVKAR